MSSVFVPTASRKRVPLGVFIYHLGEWFLMYATLATTKGQRHCSTRTRETNNNVNIRPTFKQAAFRQTSACFRRLSPANTIEKIGFHFYKVLLRQFVHLLSFYAIFNFVNWLFLNSKEFELGSMYLRSNNFFFWADESYIVHIHEIYLNSRFRGIDNAGLTRSILNDQTTLSKP